MNDKFKDVIPWSTEEYVFDKEQTLRNTKKALEQDDAEAFKKTIVKLSKM